MAIGTVVALHRRRQLDGTWSSSGPFTRAVPAASVERAVATVYQAIPKESRVPSDAEANAASSSAHKNTDGDSATGLLIKRIVRMLYYHEDASTAQAAKRLLAKRDLGSLQRYRGDMITKYGPESESEIPAQFMPMAAAPVRPADWQSTQTPGIVTEVRVAGFHRPEATFSRTLLLPVTVAATTARSDPGTLTARCEATNGIFDVTTTAVYPAVKSVPLS